MRTIATVAAAAAVSLVAVVPAGAAAKAKPRVFHLPYQWTTSVQGVISGAVSGGSGQYGYVTLPTSTKDRSVAVAVVDQRGLPIAFQLSQGDVRQTSSLTDVGEYCSATPKPVALPHPGQQVDVYVELGVCGSSPSVPTMGTVTLTLR